MAQAADDLKEKDKEGSAAQDLLGDARTILKKINSQYTAPATPKKQTVPNGGFVRN